jgi:hypothetical protein
MPGFNKISGQVVLPGAALPISLPAGGLFILPAGQGILGTFGAINSPQLGTGNELTGQYALQLGQYSSLQTYDPGLQYWRDVNVSPMAMFPFSSDGTNFRLANTTGCPVGALITNGGTGLANGFNTVVVTPSAGGSTWNTLVGGAINTTITITAGGTLYQAPPILVFAPPNNQGSTPYILPTAVATLTAGVITGVTVLNVGAGLVAVPQLTVVPVPGDLTGGGAVLTPNATLAQSGVLLAMWPRATVTGQVAGGTVQPQPYGTPLTAVPTFTFAPASTIAATAIMNFTVTGFTQSTPGVGYVGAGGAFFGGYVAGTAANANPLFDKGLSIPIFPAVTVAATTGLPSLAGVFTGVNIQAVPTFASYSSGAAPGTAAVTTVTVGGTSDTCLLMPI